MSPAPASTRAGGPRIPNDVYSVSRLNQESRRLLEASFPAVWVEGEISNLRDPGSGHLYFSLKDSDAQINCALFRGNRARIADTPRDGMQVLARGRVSLFEARGAYQLIVDYLEEAGEGALRRAYEQLRRRLAAEGLFASERKRALPAFPRTVGVITSDAGAAVRDIIITLRRRFPAARVLVYPVPVQGAVAAAPIVAALKLAGQRGDCDVLILARGGGSLEDLWAFNDEAVARAIAECPIPVVTGIGHETDITIADFVADHRAPTPTGAAEQCTPHRDDVLATFARYSDRVHRAAQTALQTRAQQLDRLRLRMAQPQTRIRELLQRLSALCGRLPAALRDQRQQRALQLAALAARLGQTAPTLRIAAQRARHNGLLQRLPRAAGAVLTTRTQRLESLRVQLRAVSPQATLDRGYAVLSPLADRTAVVRNANAVALGSRVRATLARGSLTLTVDERDEDAQ